MIIELNNTQGRINTVLTLDQLSILSNECSFEVDGAEFKQAQFSKKSHGKCQWDGHRRLFNTQHQTFPVGLFPRIKKLLDTVGAQYDIVDNRAYSGMGFNTLPILGDLEVRQYQNDIVIKSLIHRNGIVKSATGSGKTTIAALTMSALGKKSVFIVHTKDLLHQAKETFERLFQTEIGQIGDGKVDPKFVTVATIQTLARVIGQEIDVNRYDEDSDDGDDTEINQDTKKLILDWSRTVGAVLFDEVQRVGSRTAYAVRFMFKNSENAFGYSASPWRDDGADLMIEASFGDRIVDITASELIRAGYLVQPIICVKKVSNGVWKGKDYTQIYKSAIVENMFRNMQVVNDAIEYYNKGMCTLILVTQIKHGETLSGMINGMGTPAVFISGKSKSKRRQEVIADMRSGKAPLVIATTIADVGLDVPRIQAIVEAGAGKSSVTALQRLGRIMRTFNGKDKCYFTTYRDNVPIICNHIDKKIKIWRTEPEFIIMEE